MKDKRNAPSVITLDEVEKGFDYFVAHKDISSSWFEESVGEEGDILRGITHISALNIAATKQSIITMPAVDRVTGESCLALCILIDTEGEEAAQGDKLELLEGSVDNAVLSQPLAVVFLGDTSKRFKVAKKDGQ